MRAATGQGNIVVHSRKERRYRCNTCRRTFAETTLTPFYRLHTPQALVVIVLTLLAYGCPIPAIVAAFALDERTIAAWVKRAGDHCAAVQRHFLRPSDLPPPVDLQHVQADELYVKLAGKRVWLAMALAVPFRLWLDGVISTERDRYLIRDLMDRVRRCARSFAILVCVDGFSTYVKVCCRRFKEVLPHEGRGGVRKRLPEGFLLGQVIKTKLSGRVVDVAHRAVIGSLEAIEKRLQETGGGQVINTAFIERLNATFRSRLAALVRRGRCLARTEASLQNAMYLVGVVYNFCTEHESLRIASTRPEEGRWQERTPAMAAGLTDHCWSVAELMRLRLIPQWWPPLKKPKREKKPSGEGLASQQPVARLSTV